MTVEHLIFDLDNTLYPPTAEMDGGITRRMMTCVADFFGVDYDEAVRLRARRIAGFSTTLEWLRSEGLTDVEGYFRRVHPEDEADELPPSPELRPLLASLPQPKVILTNAPAEHASRVLQKLDVADLFDAVCDIRSSELFGKPYPQAFRNALAAFGGAADIENTLFLDDMRKYTDGYAALGGTAVLVGGKNGHALSPGAAAVSKDVPPHPGRTLRIKSVYELPTLLQKICEM
ncbi:MAG: HAD-IA family hydrolase [Treponemataceae bacterium]|nr:HAD-IA family hydrolase [Treponemataceae bacterium]